MNLRYLETSNLKFWSRLLIFMLLSITSMKTTTPFRLLMITTLRRSTKTSASATNSPSRMMNLAIERSMWDKNIPFVIGVDEVGRGCIAGPVVSAAVCISNHTTIISDVNDSKLVTEQNRERIYKIVMQDCSIVLAHALENNTIIDEVNILQSTMRSMFTCIMAVHATINSRYNPPKDGSQIYAIVDGSKCPNKLPIKSRPLVKGDALCYSIALASIVAKVERDRMMVEYDKLWPVYGFARHKGYPTREHILAIHQHGPCPIHRMTFKPLKGRLPTTSSP